MLQNFSGAESDLQDNGGVVDDAGETRNDADGVLVVSAWTRGAADDLLARITMSGKGSTPLVRAVTSRDELHAAIDEWLGSLTT